MAPPPGTLRVSRYFTALGLILGVLYLIVFLPGTANTPKLGIDLVGGIRVIFTATPPAGQPITSTAMDQARQIIEDRINGTGVTASTVQIQGDDQLVVSIPGGTDTDVRRLGQAAQLNFRPMIAPLSPVACNQGPTAKTIATLPASSPSATTAPTGSPTTPPTGSATTPKSSPPRASAGTSSSNSAAPRDASHRILAAAPSDSGTATAPQSAPNSTAKSTAKSGAKSGATTSGAPTAPTSSPPPTVAPSQQANQPCLTNAAGVVDKVIKQATNNAKSDQIGKLIAADPAYFEKLYSKLPATDKTTLTQAMSRLRCDTAATTQADTANTVYVACDENKQFVYLLGQIIVPGTQIDEANAVAPSTGQGGNQKWTISLTLKDSGRTKWGDWTTAHNTSSSNAADPSQCGLEGAAFPCNDFVAFTLDGQVKSAPATNEPIVGQATQISGDFNQGSANALADQLKYGALPLNFKAESNERVSASLGTSQLQAAFLAGGIGLALVVIYSLLYYRGLGIVTIASLIVSGLLTYAMIVILGQQIGFTLDLAGIAGLIVALGITADSFVVFFERIKDEVHEGRSVRVAVPRGWVRARRTVVSADIVSFLAAVILYIFASADVKGFAFTLGLSTILDLLVVFIFTHPIVSLLSRSRAFGNPRFTGLNAVRRGGVTRGTETPRGKLAGSARRSGGSRPARSSTVVLDKDEPIEDGVDDTVDETDVVDASGTAPVEPDERVAADERVEAAADDARDDTETDDVADDVADADSDADAASEGAADDAADAAEDTRRHTTPAAGSAAERAAARRARMREQREKGDD